MSMVVTPAPLPCCDCGTQTVADADDDVGEAELALLLQRKGGVARDIVRVSYDERT